MHVEHQVYSLSRRSRSRRTLRLQIHKNDAAPFDFGSSTPVLQIRSDPVKNRLDPAADYSQNTRSIFSQKLIQHLAT
jgi:hypothetical protein